MQQCPQPTHCSGCSSPHHATATTSSACSTATSLPTGRSRSARCTPPSAASSGTATSSLAGTDQAEGPERRFYAITGQGSQTLASWLAEPIDPEPHLQATLFTKVTLAVLTGREVTPLLDAQRHAHLARMRELTALRRAASLPIALLADYALFHLEADLRWIELTAARVGELTKQIVPLLPSAVLEPPHPGTVMDEALRLPAATLHQRRRPRPVTRRSSRRARCSAARGSCAVSA